VAQMVESLQGGGEDMGGGQAGLDPGLMPSPDSGNTGQWSPGNGQVPDFSSAVTPQGSSKGRGGPFGALGQGQ
jgi:hypothetical protein